VPVELSARFRTLARDRLSLEARAGVGLLAIQHTVSSEFQRTAGAGQLGATLFAGAIGGWAMGTLVLTGELRLAWAPVRTSLGQAELGGLQLLVGARVPW
jgi:hypothetical protein